MTRVQIELAIAVKQAQLDAANASYLSSLQNAEAMSYLIDTGEGKQAVTRRKPAEISKEIKEIETEINRLYNRLNGGGLVSMTLRRRL